MFEALGSVVSGAASGGIIGLAGTAFSLLFKGFTVYQERKAKQEEREHELNVIEMEAKVAAQQAEAELHKIEAETAGALAVEQEKVAGETMTASYKHDKPEYSEGLVKNLLSGRWFARFFGILSAFLFVVLDFLRGFMRIAITAASLYMFWRISQELNIFNAQSLSEEIRSNLALRIVNDISMIATATSLWWFGTRPTRTSGK